MTSQELFESMYPDAAKNRLPGHFKHRRYYPPHQHMWETWQNAIERIGFLHIRRPPPKWANNAGPVECVYQDAFDRGYAAGVAAYRQRVRKLTEQT